MFLDNGKIFNDNKKPEDFENFLLGALKNIYLVTKDEMSIYVCHATKTQGMFFNAFLDAGFHFSQTIIWLKERIILALGRTITVSTNRLSSAGRRGKFTIKTKRYARRKRCGT